MNWYIATWFEADAPSGDPFDYKWELKYTNVFAPTLYEARSLIRATDLQAKRFIHFEIHKQGTEDEFLELQGQLSIDFKELTPDLAP